LPENNLATAATCGAPARTGDSRLTSYTAGALAGALPVVPGAEAEMRILPRCSG
jgi:hypothetical protein